MQATQLRKRSVTRKTQSSNVALRPKIKHNNRQTAFSSSQQKSSESWQQILINAGASDEVVAQLGVKCRGFDSKMVVEILKCYTLTKDEIATFGFEDWLVFSGDVTALASYLDSESGILVQGKLQEMIENLLKFEHIEATKLFITKKPKILYVPNKYGDFVIHIAANLGAFEIVEWLLQQYPLMHLLLAHDGLSWQDHARVSRRAIDGGESEESIIRELDLSTTKSIINALQLRCRNLDALPLAEIEQILDMLFLLSKLHPRQNTILDVYSRVKKYVVGELTAMLRDKNKFSSAIRKLDKYANRDCFQSASVLADMLINQGVLLRSFRPLNYLQSYSLGKAITYLYLSMQHAIAAGEFPTTIFKKIALCYERGKDGVALNKVCAGFIYAAIKDESALSRIIDAGNGHDYIDDLKDFNKERFEALLQKLSVSCQSESTPYIVHELLGAILAFPDVLSAIMSYEEIAKVYFNIYADRHNGAPTLKNMAAFSYKLRSALLQEQAVYYDKMAKDCRESAAGIEVNIPQEFYGSLGFSVGALPHSVSTNICNSHVSTSGSSYGRVSQVCSVQTGTRALIDDHDDDNDSDITEVDGRQETLGKANLAELSRVQEQETTSIVHDYRKKNL